MDSIKERVQERLTERRNNIKKLVRVTLLLHVSLADASKVKVSVEKKDSSVRDIISLCSACAQLAGAGVMIVTIQMCARLAFVVSRPYWLHKNPCS